MALGQRAHDGHSVKDGHLIHHSGAAPQYRSIPLTGRLSLEHVAVLIEWANGLNPEKTAHIGGGAKPRVIHRAA
jgi:hypothetical protein